MQFTPKIPILKLFFHTWQFFQITTWSCNFVHGILGKWPHWYLQDNLQVKKEWNIGWMDILINYTLLWISAEVGFLRVAECNSSQLQFESIVQCTCMIFTSAWLHSMKYSQCPSQNSFVKPSFPSSDIASFPSPEDSCHCLVRHSVLRTVNNNIFT